MNKKDTDNKITYSVSELAQASSLSKSFLRNEIRAGKLKARRIGRRVLILASDFAAYFEHYGTSTANNRQE